MKTIELEVGYELDVDDLERMYGMDAMGGADLRIQNRDGINVPATFPESPYMVKLGLVSFPELGKAELAPDACISLVEGRKGVVRVATLWELHAAIVEYGRRGLGAALGQEGGYAVIAWGTVVTVFGTVKMVPCWHSDVPEYRCGRILTPSLGDTFPFGAYTNLVVVE